MIEWVTWMHGIDDLDDLPSIHLCMHCSDQRYDESF